MRVIWIWLFAVCMASAAHASEDLQRGPRPDWVKAHAEPATPPVASGEAFQIELSEQQIRFDETGWHAYIRSRVHVLSPQALGAFGSVTIPWNPASQSVVVHSVDILRGDQRIDALEGRTFSVLRREENLEAAALDGLLTGNLQLEDVRVGDRLEFSYSVTTNIAILGQHAEFMVSAAAPFPVAQYYLRGSWPTASGMRLRASDDWAAPRVVRQGDRSEFELSMTDLQPILVPDDAPVRYHAVRLLEASDYASWADLSAVFAPLYAAAATLAPESPLHAEIARIRASSPDPRVQAIAALRLVQDEVRYLALSMGEGGLVPATADQTWNRRLGDCKGKTALLLAILKELGIKAEPALVNTAFGNLDRFLPRVSAFDHVLVRAEVDGDVVWLDGARVGDRSLVPLEPITYGWVLPLESSPGALVQIAATPPKEPLRENRFEIDLTGGLYAPATVTGDVLYRGDAATLLQAPMSVAPQAQRDAYMRGVWTGLIDGIDVVSMQSAYDEETGALRMTMTGKLTLDWSSSGAVRTMIPISRISWDAGERREAGPFQDLPRPTNFPTYNHTVVSLLLPNEGEGFRVDAEDIDETAAGYRYTRRTTKDGARVTMDRTSIALRPEMTEAERVAAVPVLARLASQPGYIVATARYQPNAQDVGALQGGDGESARDLVTRALALQNSRMYAEAIAVYDRAVATEPTYANAWANRGIAKFWAGDATASADFDKASELDPNERVAMNGRGMLAQRERRYLDAVVEFTLSLRASPDDAFILSRRASAYAGLKQWDKALEDMRKVRTLNPDDMPTALQEVSLLLSADRATEAVAAIDAQVLKTPDVLLVRMLQATAHEEAADLAGAEAALDQALRIQPGDPNVLMQRAGVRLKRDNPEGGRADLTEARTAAEGSAGLLNNICWTRALAGFEPEEALKDCDAALALEPKAAGIIDSRAMVLLLLNRPEEALAAYDAALALDPDLIASRYGRAVALEKLGRADEGARDRAAALLERPDLAEQFAVVRSSR